MALRNRSSVPQGMLAPSGYVQTLANASVQATTRPAGTLLPPSPGYMSVRRGKNRFQGKGPTGGFRQQEYAEDVGGTGAVLSVTPGDTTSLEASEWLPEGADSVPEGSVIISDREHDPSTASSLHEAYNTIPDMGDRHPSRPLSRFGWRQLNPAAYLREDYAESPALTVAVAIGLVFLVNVVLRDFEDSYRRSRGGGGIRTATAVPSAGAQTAGDVSSDAINKIGSAADNAVEKIGQAADSAVNAIEDAAKSAKNTVTGE